MCATLKMNRSYLIRQHIESNLKTVHCSDLKTIIPRLELNGTIFVPVQKTKNRSIAESKFSKIISENSNLLRKVGKPNKMSLFFFRAVKIIAAVLKFGSLFTIIEKTRYGKKYKGSPITVPHYPFNFL